MPHPKGNVKLSGDIHLPDVESDLAVEEGRTGMEALAYERTESGRRGGVRKAGLLIDPDLGTTDRLPHVIKGERIEPGEDPLAGYSTPTPPRKRVSKRKVAFALVAGWLLYKLVRH